MEVTLPKGSSGLGFSIAGGRGTAPYKENDEVNSEGNNSDGKYLVEVEF